MITAALIGHKNETAQGAVVAQAALAVRAQGIEDRCETQLVEGRAHHRTQAGHNPHQDHAGVITKVSSIDRDNKERFTMIMKWISSKIPKNYYTKDSR